MQKFNKSRYIKMKERVKEILKARGMTAKDLSQKMGLSEAALSLSLKGNPTLSRIQEIAEALEVEVSDLFAPKESPFKCPYCGKPLKVTVE